MTLKVKAAGQNALKGDNGTVLRRYLESYLFRLFE
jgi:hypothetical protein